MFAGRCLLSVTVEIVTMGAGLCRRPERLINFDCLKEQGFNGQKDDIEKRALFERLRKTHGNEFCSFSL